MTPPLHRDLILTTPEGRCVGRYSTLSKILTPFEAQYATDLGPLDEPRWFRLHQDGQFVVCKEPLKWEIV